MNQIKVIGPKYSPTLPEPRFCKQKIPKRITTAAVGMKYFTKLGLVMARRKGFSCSAVVCAPTSLTPSSAESTEIAGVITPSPNNKAVPKTPSRTSPLRCLRLRGWLGSCGWAASTFLAANLSWAEASETRVMMPPSPSSFASIMKRTYLMVTTQVSAQIIIDRAGMMTCSGVAPALMPLRRHSRKA